MEDGGKVFLNPNFKAQITNQYQNPKIKNFNFELWTLKLFDHCIIDT
jgi:hypothetical protein